MSCTFRDCWKLPQDVYDDLNALCTLETCNDAPGWFLDAYEADDSFMESSWDDIREMGVTASYDEAHGEMSFHTPNDGYPEPFMNVMCAILNHHDVDGEFSLIVNYANSEPVHYSLSKHGIEILENNFPSP